MGQLLKNHDHYLKTVTSISCLFFLVQMLFVFFLDDAKILVCTCMLVVCVFTWFKDLEMFDEVTDTPTVARTSNLNEELGQVSQCQCYVTFVRL